MFGFLFPQTQSSSGQPQAFKESIGRATWSLLHAVADLYPAEYNETYTQAFQALLNALSVVYPCDACREHIKTYLQDHPPRFENRAHTVRWVFNFHNAVNSRLGKPIFTPEQYLRRENAPIVDGRNCNECRVL